MIWSYPGQSARHITVGCLLVLVLLGGMPFSAQCTEILDDSLSPQKQYSVQFEWAHRGNTIGLSQEEFFLLKSTVSGVEVRLNTSDYEGKRARIYLTLPRQIEGFVSTERFLLSWKTDRLFYQGSVRPGNRTLLYDGVIESPVMVEMFTISLEVDARYLNGKIQYAPIYEIETY